MAYAITREALEARFDGIRVYQRAGQRAPHKPLLLLLALARLQRGLPRLVPFVEIEALLGELLHTFGKPGGRTTARYPYWYLQSDELWEVVGVKRPERMSAEPRVAVMRSTSGGLPGPIFGFLAARPDHVVALAKRLLSQHFPGSLHEDIADAVGLSLEAGPAIRVCEARREAGFRDAVLEAYEQRCAFCGFQCLLAGKAVGIEAAHVYWHSAGGPDEVGNGLALCSLHHKAFDLGILGLSEERRIRVSRKASGSEAFEATIRGLLGQGLRGPLPGTEAPAIEHIRWHGAQVFKSPELRLR